VDKKQKKQIKKRILGLEKQKKIHEEKVKTLVGRKDTTKDYWEKEIEKMDKEIEELESRLED